jgi:glutamate synthase (NADPH/NADH) large chain
MTGGVVVVLGRTGRNFGAGMSGGIAFVHDPDGTFPQRVNHDMVDLDPLTDQDLEGLHDRLKRHFEETESAVAEALLADWPVSAEQFVKVMPKDYKVVLEATRQAEEEGRDVTEAVMAAAHG